MISLSTKLEFKVEFVRIFEKFSVVKIYNDLTKHIRAVTSYPGPKPGLMTIKSSKSCLTDILVDSTEVELR